MKNKMKNGFTLAEVLICFLIIGIITTLTVTTTNPKSKATKYSYSNLYSGLSEGFYNAMLHKNEIDPFSIDNPKKLCEALTSYLNHTSQKCSEAGVMDLMGDNFPEEKIQFITNNGMRFYFSDKQKVEYEINGNATSFEYFMAYVDINGKKGPNQLEYIDKKHETDIFAFALLDTGRTVPLGQPEIDTRYLQTKLAYYDINAEIVYKKPSQAYYQSKSEAWGCYQVGWTKEDELKLLDPEVPFTMNDIIRENLPEKSKIRITVPVSDKTLYNSNPDYQCTQSDSANCFVVIDKYKF